MGYIILGTSTEVVSLSLKYLSTVVTYSANYSSSMSVTIPGDINDDGYLDILMASSDLGHAYVVLGNSDGFQSIPNVENIGPSGYGFEIIGNDLLGYSISGCSGDFNGDGIFDYIIGAPGEDSTSDDYNEYASSACPDSTAYVIFGSSARTNIHVSTLQEHSQGVVIKGENCSGAGYGVAGLGNINGEGKLAAVIIGAPYLDTYAGAAFVVFGNSSLSEVELTNPNLYNTMKIIGVDSYDYTGYAVSSAGITCSFP